MSIASKLPAAPPTAATTAEVAQAARLSVETILRLKRLEHKGPFQRGRDWQFVGLGARKIRWNKEQAIQSLWNHKRQPASEVETFSRDGAPRS